jgi:hypothetical protein
MKTEATLAHGCYDEEVLRELASYDMRFSECVPFVKGNTVTGLFNVPKSISSFHWSRQYEYTWAIQNSDLKPTDICLDAGGGFSTFKYALAKRTQKVISIDLNLESIGKAINSNKKLGFTNVEMYKSAIEDYNPGFQFDKIFCISVIEHIPSPEIRAKCIENLFKLVKPNGMLFITLDFVATNDLYSYDFYIDKVEANNLLLNLGVKDFLFKNDAMFAMLPNGCKINVLCLKIQK